MACRVFILDFDRQDLFKATDPQTIARSCRPWEKDIQSLSPWEKIHTSFPDNTDDTPAWQPELPGDGPDVLVCGICASTMDAAWHFFKTRRMKQWDSVMAVEQKTGRGQYKRQWISPPGNIHASWLWPLPEFGRGEETGWHDLLPLVAGFIFARVFMELKVPVRIKWPNDLLVGDRKSGGDRKFGGILLEKKYDHVLVGIGVNVNYSPENSLLRNDFAVPATCLSDQGHDMSPLFLWMTLVEKGKLLFEKLIQTATPAAFIKMIDKQMAWVGKTVRVRQENTDAFEAVILGLAKDGGLRIKKGNREAVIYSGSIIPA